MIVDLLDSNIDWDDYDVVYSEMKSSEKCVEEISDLYWDLYNPEYPENLTEIDEGFHERVILFLGCEKQYDPIQFQYWLSLSAIKSFIRGKNNKIRVNKVWPFLNELDYIDAQQNHKPNQ